MNSNIRFLNVAVGFPGSIHDQRALANSSFWEKRFQLLNGETMIVDNEQINEYVVGDAGYGLSQHIMIPLGGSDLEEDEEKFNKKQSQTRIIVERAFGRWKQTWAIFDSRIKRPHLPTLYQSMIATCVLHNVLLDMNETDLSERGFTPEVHQPEEEEVQPETQDERFRGEIQRSAMFNYIIGL